jgi:hypothetical protein
MLPSLAIFASLLLAAVGPAGWPHVRGPNYDGIVPATRLAEIVRRWHCISQPGVRATVDFAAVTRATGLRSKTRQPSWSLPFERRQFAVDRPLAVEVGERRLQVVRPGEVGFRGQLVGATDQPVLQAVEPGQ